MSILPNYFVPAPVNVRSLKKEEVQLVNYNLCASPLVFTPQSMGETKDHRMSLGELFRNEAKRDRPQTRKLHKVCELYCLHLYTIIYIFYYMKCTTPLEHIVSLQGFQVVMHWRALSCTNTVSNWQFLHIIFNRQVHPESTASVKPSSKSETHRHTDGNNMPLCRGDSMKEDAMSSLPRASLCYGEHYRSTEHWVTTDADCKYTIDHLRLCMATSLNILAKITVKYT